MKRLDGKRVLITRPEAQAGSFCRQVEALGGIPVLLPAIEIIEIEENPLLEKAIDELQTYRWVIFTSVNGVSIFLKRLARRNQGVDVFEGLRVAAIGPATAQSLSEAGVALDFVPDEYVAEAILPGLGDIHGVRLLLPRAEIARKNLVEELRRQGAEVDEVPIYRTLAAQPDAGALAELEKGVDIATFTSSSTVRCFFEQFGERAAVLLSGATIACIGPITAQTARQFGLEVDVVAKDYTTEGLLQALCGRMMECGKG